jgi:hypothetical protein
MRAEHVGDVLVVDDREGRRRTGDILTDRDLEVRVLAREIDPRSVCASDVTGQKLIVAEDHEDVHDAVR